MMHLCGGTQVGTGSYTRVSRQSPTASPAVITKATALTHMGMSVPLMVTLQPTVAAAHAQWLPMPRLPEWQL
jgi:hypothetical protein